MLNKIIGKIMLTKGLFISIVALLLASCSDDATSPDGMAEVKVISSMENSTVEVVTGKKGFLAEGIDSLVVTKFRMLISSIKLHGKLDSEDKDESLKTGPYVLTQIYNVQVHATLPLWLCMVPL